MNSKNTKRSKGRYQETPKRTSTRLGFGELTRPGITDQFIARKEFFNAIRVHAPRVAESLYRDFYIGCNYPVIRLLEHARKNGSTERWLAWSFLEEAATNNLEFQDAKNALEKWGRDFNLTDTWMLDAALELTHNWYHKSVSSLDVAMCEFAYPGVAIYESVNHVGAGIYTIKSISNPDGTGLPIELVKLEDAPLKPPLNSMYDPEVQTRKGWLIEQTKRLEQFAEEIEAQTENQEKARTKTLRDRHGSPTVAFEWLVRYRVLREEFSTITDSLTRPLSGDGDNPDGPDTTTVPKAVGRVAELIGFTL